MHAVQMDVVTGQAGVRVPKDVVPAEAFFLRLGSAVAIVAVRVDCHWMRVAHRCGQRPLSL